MKYLELARDRYQQLDARERRMLLLAVIALSITVVYLAVIEPLANYRERIESGIESQRQQVAWMRAAVEVLKERGPAGPAPQERNGSLLTVADTSARAVGLGQPLKRIQQDGNDGVRARLEGASFDQLVIWLEDLETRHGVVATEMTVDRAEGDGLVNASLTLTREGT